MNSRKGGSFKLGELEAGGGKEKAVVGKATFDVGTWHTVELVMTMDMMSATLNGVHLGNITFLNDATFAFMMQLDSYVYAQMDNWKLS